MNSQIKKLDSDGIDDVGENYPSSLLLYAYKQHDKHGNGLAMTLQILLELQALVEEEIIEVKSHIVSNELSKLWRSGDCAGSAEE